MSRLGELLVERGAITLEDVARAREAQQPGERLGDSLVRLGALTPQDLARALADQTGLPLCDLRVDAPTPEALEALPTRLVFRANVLPLARVNGTLRVGTADPFAVEALDELRLLTGLDVEPMVVASDQLADAIHRFYGVGADALDQAAQEGLRTDHVIEEAEGDLATDDDAALIQFVNRLLLDAVQARASDIHVEPAERELAVRYRVDGVLRAAKLPRELKRFQSAIVSRLKIMAQLDIAEKRLPQDGRIRLKISGREMDVRVSVIPTLYGESLALRILDAGADPTKPGEAKKGKTLEEVGFSPEHVKTFKGFLAAPHGIVLVTGPTGSGKSTTLYGGLQQVDRSTRKVITVEDPVEYRLDGISQIQVRDKIGLTFARGLRHILRHDPDVVMVGEIRDTETAEIAVQAALTGHLVLSTLHTNDAAGAVARLVDMGVEPYLVAATIEGLCAQRLLRKVCLDCAQQLAPAALPVEERELLAELGVTDMAQITIGAGCETCAGSGYFGRTPVFELIPVDDGIRELATNAASAVKMRSYVREAGHKSLRDDGVRLVRLGKTTPSEVVRVTRAG
ncbi:MAG: GspE/PulE family protein [Planctomycetota bacterium]